MGATLVLRLAIRPDLHKSVTFRRYLVVQPGLVVDGEFDCALVYRELDGIRLHCQREARLRVGHRRGWCWGSLAGHTHQKTGGLHGRLTVTGDGGLAILVSTC